MKHSALRTASTALVLTLAAACSGSADAVPSSDAADVTSGAVTTPAALANVKTVFVIVMENHNWTDIKGNPSARYLNQLAAQGAHAENYVNVPGNHPSEPNYLWMTAGTSFGVKTDDNPSTNHQSTHAHLAALLDAAHISWKSYQEDITGTTCPLTSHGLYAPKHDPFVYYDDETGNRDVHNASCIAHNRPYTELAGDLSNDSVARFNFITPNLCDDMHNDIGCATHDSVKNGDTWLASAVPQILGSQAYKNGGALFITWDESEHGDFPIGFIALSPWVKPGYVSSTKLSHSSFLRTLQEIFAVGPFLGDAANATDLSEMFAAGAPAPAPAPSPPTEQYTLPQASLTPGAVLTTDVSVISKAGYPATVRHVTSAEKAQVASAYHFTGASSSVEYDHLVSIELGGSNDLTNLWPQPIEEAKVKDGLEDYLHAKVIEGKLPLAEVQKRIAADWVKLWNDVGQPGPNHPGLPDPQLD
jgi:hypothetical protein